MEENLSFNSLGSNKNYERCHGRFDLLTHQLHCYRLSRKLIFDDGKEFIYASDPCHAESLLRERVQRYEGQISGIFLEPIVVGNMAYIFRQTENPNVMMYLVFRVTFNQLGRLKDQRESDGHIRDQIAEPAD